MAIQLTTFGGLHVVDDADPDGLVRLLAQRSRAALFIYLAVERRVSRESASSMFWPESDTENARHALRQSLYQLRRTTGDDDWIVARAHELTVTDAVRTDAHAFTDALQQGDLDAAIRLYRGPFLDGIHLVDLRAWESWVDAKRAQYARAFRKACRDLLDARRTAGDLAGAIQAAERWIERTPTDDEAQHRLIEALAAAGERAEAISQYEAYVRLAEADGLQPLEETRTLVERLRSHAHALPALRAGSPPVPPEHPGSDAYPVKRIATPEPAPRRWRPSRWLVSAAAVATTLIAAAWGLRSTLVARPPAPTPAAIAVLPFSVHGGESAHYLRDGIVNLLATALDGAGALRPVDARATLAAVTDAGGAVPDARHADRIAAGLDAELFVLGDVVEAGGRIQLEAAVYDVGGGDSARSRAVVSGPADSLFALVDRLAASLLGDLGDPSADRLLRTASATTSSLAAFKAYLQGEELMRAARFERAAEAYLAAIALDSTFAVAHYRLALALEWAPLPGNVEAANAAARHGARLSIRDRMLLDAFRQFRAGDAAQADRAYRTILARYPDDVDAWSQLGEILFHHGQLFGHHLGESEEAWRKVLFYEPRNRFALIHVARIAAVGGRISALDSVVKVFQRLDPVGAPVDRRLHELLILQAVATGDTAAARTLARDLKRGATMKSSLAIPESFAVWRVAVFLAAFSPDEARMRAVIGELIEDYPNPGLRADLHWIASMLDLSRGHARAAKASLSEAVRSEQAMPAAHRRRAYEAVTEWFAATLPLPYEDSTLAWVRRRAMSARPLPAGPGTVFVNELELGTSIQLEPLRQYTVGLLSLRLRDTATAAAAARQLARLAAADGASALVRDLDRGLRARLAWVAGRPNDALRLLETLEYRDSQGDVVATPFAARANERFLHGEILMSMGRHADALRWFASLGDGAVSETPWRAPSQLRQAEIHERLGHRDQAIQHYERFVTLWRDADPEFQPDVNAARRRLGALQDHADARESRIPVGSSTLYAREIGRGRPMIVLHGGPDFDTGYLLPELDELSDGYRLLYYDQRGRGKSAERVRPEDVTLASDVDDLDRVRRHFRLNATGLLGHSWGTVLALEYALSHPTEVSHLILMNPAPASAVQMGVLRTSYLAQLGSDMDRQRAIMASAAYRNGDPATVAARYRIHFRHGLRRPADYEKLMARMSAGFFGQGKEGILKAWTIEERLYRDTWQAAGYDLLPRVRELRIPTLVIVGEQDFIPTQIAARIAQAMPSATLVRIRDCGHFAYLECGTEVRRAIDEFLRRIGPSR